MIAKKKTRVRPRHFFMLTDVIRTYKAIMDPYLDNWVLTAQITNLYIEYIQVILRKRGKDMGIPDWFREEVHADLWRMAYTLVYTGDDAEGWRIAMKL